MIATNSFFNSWNVISTACICLLVFVVIGCEQPDTSNSIINKTTQDIGEFNPDGEQNEADLQVKTSANPLASMGAYGFAVGEVSKLSIEKALQLFNAEHGRYPKDHDEFMSQIIERNNINLPVLPGKRQYQYDVANHELKIVEAEKK